MKTSQNIFSLFLITASVILLSSALGHAQTPTPAPVQSPAATADETAVSFKDVTTNKDLNRFASESDSVIDDGYAPPTFKNLSKMYWALAMFDMSDSQAIDSFLMINECELFKKFYSSDFELEGLREATRASITKNMASFPTRFEIMIPIGLDRYNTGTERFTIDRRSQFLGSKRLEIAVNDDLEPVCGNKGARIPKYPKNFILTLSRPFVITEVPVAPELAQFYIEQSEAEASSKPFRQGLSKFSRVAYLRLKVTMNQFKGYGKADAQSDLTDIFGTIDGYEMYADRDKTLLLFNEVSAAKQKAKRSAKGVMQIPGADQQLIESQDQQSVEKREEKDPNKILVSPETGTAERGFALPPTAPAQVSPPPQK